MTCAAAVSMLPAAQMLRRAVLSHLLKCVVAIAWDGGMLEEDASSNLGGVVELLCDNFVSS